MQFNIYRSTYIYIHALVFRVNTTPPWYGPMKPCHPRSDFYCPIIRLLAFHVCLYSRTWSNSLHISYDSTLLAKTSTPSTSNHTHPQAAYMCGL